MAGILGRREKFGTGINSERRGHAKTKAEIGVIMPQPKQWFLEATRNQNSPTAWFDPPESPEGAWPC